MKSLDQSLWIYSQILPYIGNKNKRNGNIHIMQCPFCDEAHTSHKKNAMRGYYYVDTQTYYCFRCDKFANSLELYEKLSNLPKKDLLPEYMSFIRKSNYNMKGVNFSNFTSITSNMDTISNHKLDIVFDSIPSSLKHELTKRGYEYLNKRKVFQSKNLPSYGKFYSAMFKGKYEVVVIPWYMEGCECYYQWRFIDSDVPYAKYGFPKGLDKKIYGIDMIDANFPYIICTEGVFDSLWIKNGIALGGKALTDLQRQILNDRFPKHKIVYAFDNDDAGIESILKHSSKNPNSLVFYWKDISDGCKDLNDYILTHDCDTFFNEDRIMNCIYDPLQLKISLLKSSNR